MDPYKTPGAFSWFELMTTDPKSAVAFYGQLFGWTSKDMDMGTGPYHVQSIGEAGIGGIMGMPPDAPAGMPPMWGCYVTVSSVEETCARCEQLGGKVCMPAMDVPGVGRMAVIQDPQGATLNVIAYAG